MIDTMLHYLDVWWPTYLLLMFLYFAIITAFIKDYPYSGEKMWARRMLMLPIFPVVMVVDIVLVVWHCVKRLIEMAELPKISMPSVLRSKERASSGDLSVADRTGGDLSGFDR